MSIEHLRNRGRWTLSVGAVGAALAFAGHASAQADAAIREATARFQEGLHLHDAGQEEEARVKFVQAYAVLHTPNILFDLARSEQLTGHALESLDHYKQYARSTDARVTAKDRETAKQHIQELTSKVGHVTVDAPAGTKLTVDGIAVAGEAPFADPLDVAAGSHVLRARQGDAIKTAPIAAGPGETMSIKFEFADAASAGAAGVTTTAAPVPSGPDLQAPPPPAPVPDRPIEESHGGAAKTATVIALASGAVVAVGVGIGFAVAGANASSAIDADHRQITNAGGNPASFCLASNAAPCPDEVSQTTTRNTDTKLEAGFFVAGGALALGALAAWIFWPTRGVDSSPRTWIAPTVTRTGGSMSVVGRF